MAFFDLKQDQDFENRVAHPHQDFPGIQPPPPPRGKEGKKKKRLEPVMQGMGGRKFRPPPVPPW